VRELRRAAAVENGNHSDERPMILKPMRVLAAICATSIVGSVALAEGGVAANPVGAAPAAKADPRAAIVKKIDGLKLEDVRMTPVDGVYEITRGSEISYASSDGRYVILGDMVDIDKDANLSENRRRTIRQRLIDTVPEAEMLVFSPKHPKYTITVFTDIDCGYCRRLHSQIAEYNRLGIRVRYLFYPRTGPDTDSWYKAEAVWCAPNRNEALTRAKNGETIKSPDCHANSIVARDYELGHKLAVEGTPAIFLASGEMLPGYAPPSQLAHYLKTGKM
jgi:thiol:disulfide interchange protein DsbC